MEDEDKVEGYEWNGVEVFGVWQIILSTDEVGWIDNLSLSKTPDLCVQRFSAWHWHIFPEIKSDWLTRCNNRLIAYEPNINLIQWLLYHNYTNEIVQ